LASRNGINAPELSEPGGKPSRDHLIWLVRSGTVVLKTYKDPTDKYGRWLADVFSTAEVNLSQQMITDGFAVGWDGTETKPQGEHA
jgi:endonuclease YncB( thermonuclease family)